jgi:hypothetical protein
MEESSGGGWGREKMIVQDRQKAVDHCCEVGCPWFACRNEKIAAQKYRDSYVLSFISKLFVKKHELRIFVEDGACLK